MTDRSYGDASVSLLFDLCRTLDISLADLVAHAEGKTAAKPGAVKLKTKWEKVRSKVDRLPEAKRRWVADVLEVMLGG